MGCVVTSFLSRAVPSQENGSNDAICKFTADKGVKFRVMDKARAQRASHARHSRAHRCICILEQIDVNGPNTSPVWAFLKKETKSGDVSWNFAAKFIVDKSGKVVERNSDSPNASEAKLKALL